MTDGETLREIIAGEISDRGPMTFRRYMELCLYHPAWGYYNRRDPVIGRAGDFYTSPQVGAVFGRTLARQVEEVWDLAGRPDEFWVVEYSAGTGAMAADVIGGLAAGELAAHLRYLIVETSPARRDEQAALIGATTEAVGVRVPVAWASDLGPVGGAAACILANELVDAFPVHVVRGGVGDGAGLQGSGLQGSGLQELYVNTVQAGGTVRAGGTIQAGGPTAFDFVPSQPSTAELQTYLDWLGVNLVEGQTAEVNL
ncbi:MAG: SAM-dependent methyltransferase, partial [Bacillota bacterium]